MRKLYSLVIGLVVLGLVLSSFGCVAPKPVPTTPAEVSFAGKIITMIVGGEPGSGRDVTARLYSKFLGRFLPGKPTIIVRNMPGGAGTIAGNYFYRSKPDGLTLFITGSTELVGYVLGMKAVQYDLKKMEPILGTATGFYFFMKSGIINKVEELPKAKGIRFGFGPGVQGYIFVTCTQLMDIHPEKVILAYTGGADARRAFLAGETNMTAAAMDNYELFSPYIAKGEMMLLFQSGILDEKGDIVRDPGITMDIPTTKEVYEKLYGKPPSGMVWEVYKGLVAAGRGFQDIMFLPPGTPDSIVRTYWDAAQKMLQDPDFRAVADPMYGKSSPWAVGEALSKRFKLNIGMKPELVDWIKGAMKEYGVVIE